MNAWGDKMLAAVHTVAQMAAIGFGLPAAAFTERMKYGPHLLAPTGEQCDDSVCLVITACRTLHKASSRKERAHARPGCVS